METSSNRMTSEMNFSLRLKKDLKNKDSMRARVVNERTRNITCAPVYTSWARIYAQIFMKFKI